MTTVSYVVTLYNKRPFLPHLLAGLAWQEGGFERQLIFVDDGSTDDTVDYLSAATRGWQNMRLIRQANAGPAAAMNAGIAVAEGDFIKPVDGDDMLAPWATGQLLAAIEESGRPVAFADVMRTAGYIPGEPPEKALAAVSKEPLRLQLETDSLAQSLRHARTNPTTWLARAETVRQVGGCDAGVFVQDYSAELRLAALTDFARLDNTIFFAPQEASDRLSVNKAQTLHDCTLAVVRFLRDHPELDKRRRAFGMRRAAGRAYAWARRHGGKGVLSAEFACYALSLIGRLPPTERVEMLLCGPFRATSPIRLPSPVKKAV
jgi:glycosyltransferase involved in cell wall biosynthesis